MKHLRWETFARVRAQLDAGLHRDRVLAEANVDEATWLCEEESLLAELADEVERADFANIESYRKAYRAAWTELTHLGMVDSPQAVEGSTPQPLPILSPESPEALSPSAPLDVLTTATLTAPFVFTKDPLPFQSAPSRQAAPRQESASPPRSPAPATSEPSWATTTAPQPALIHAASVLPFRPPSEPPTSPSTLSPAAALAPPSPEMARGASSDLVSRLTLAQYASISAELAVFPQQVETTFQRYGLVSPHERLAVDRVWRERLRQNSTEYREWQRLYQHYQAYWTDPARHDDRSR